MTHLIYCSQQQSWRETWPTLNTRQWIFHFSNEEKYCSYNCLEPIRTNYCIEKLSPDPEDKMKFTATMDVSTEALRIPFYIHYPFVAELLLQHLQKYENPHQSKLIVRISSKYLKVYTEVNNCDGLTCIHKYPLSWTNESWFKYYKKR